MNGNDLRDLKFTKPKEDITYVTEEEFEFILRNRIYGIYQVI